MEETKPNVPTPPQGLRKMPPPPPRPQAMENNSQPNPEIVEIRQEPQMEKKEETLSSLVENTDDAFKAESVKAEKPKKEKKSKSNLLYWGGFILSLALIAFCIFMLVK